MQREERNNLIIATLGKLDIVTDYCYQQQEGEAYQALLGFTEVLMALLDTIFLSEEDEEQGNEAKDRIIAVLQQALAAMQEHDLVTLADVLTYGLKEELEKLIND